ncbi:MAG: helix-turn-helix transcriptional regulator [Chloroflexota bacterium]|jgi:transcriptional regulator with XRE-family HTH domain
MSGSALDYSFGPGFDSLKDELLQTPSEKDEYERSVRTMTMIRKLLMAIDEERERRNMTKNELAELAGVHPQVIRRLFTSERANPTLKTVFSVLAALKIDLEFKTPEATAESAKDKGKAYTAPEQRRSSGRRKANKREAA